MKAVFAALAVFAVTGAAQAQNTVEVTYYEQDLLNPARVADLKVQIRRAAERVCNVRDAITARDRQLARNCVEEAKARAIAALEVRVAEVNSDAGAIRIAASNQA